MEKFRGAFAELETRVAALGDAENERCDQLAVQAAHQENPPQDDGYESPSLAQLGR